MARSGRLPVPLLVLALSLVSGAARASVLVEAMVTATSGQFDYDVEVDNQLGEDVVLVVLLDAPAADAVLGASLTAPAGHATQYDPDLGAVDLIEDGEVFAAGAIVSGFSFSSPTGPGSGFFERFEAYTAAGEQLTGAIEILPEPGGAAIWSTGLVLLALLSRDRQRTRQVSPYAGRIAK